MSKKLKVLVACEESQAVCKAFRELGHEAYSCDIQPCSGGRPEWHIQGDVLPLLGQFWDLIIAHPPCTYLSNAGVCRLISKKNGLNKERYALGIEAKEFFMKFLNAKCDRICVENPIPTKIWGLPDYTQVVQPFHFGHPFRKKTCLWLRGLSPLTPTQIVEPHSNWVSGGKCFKDGKQVRNPSPGFRDKKTRSKTFEGIAKAMAEQWGGKVTE